jgi:2-phosphosulfolactate phosphatase
VANRLAGRHGKIAVIVAGSKGEFREEDQMCCAWIGRDLMKAGYTLANDRTREIVERWHDSPPEACLNGNSANYLRRSGQLKDLDFILSHINDLDGAFVLKNDEIIEVFDGVMSLGRARGSLSNFAEAR